MGHGTDLSGAWGARRGEQIERADGQIQIRKIYGSGLRQFMYAHEIAGGRFRPAKFLVEPSQPVAVADDFLALKEEAANLHYVLDGALPKAADFCDVFGENWIRSTSGVGEVGRVRFDDRGRAADISVHLQFLSVVGGGDQRGRLDRPGVGRRFLTCRGFVREA